MPSNAFLAALLALNHSRWSRAELDRFQLSRLQAIVRHASEKVPFYRDLFSAEGFRAVDLRSLDDLPSLPIAKRLEMRERPPSDLIARGWDRSRLTEHRTSGSSGVPFTIRRTWFEERLLNAFRLREYFHYGMRLTDLHARIVLGRPSPAARRAPFQLGWHKPAKARFDCLAPPAETLAALARLRPDVISGFAGTITRLAAEATEEQLQFIRPRFITTGAETLTPHMRQIISSTFGVPVFDIYGAHEFNTIACQCPESGLYHVFDSSVIVEILADGRPAAEDESGEVHVTALHSYAMPFIRYSLGDIATRGPFPCPCGAPCSTLKSILGRTVELFEMPDGSRLHPYELVVPLVRHACWVRQYQIVQRSLSHIHVKAVPSRGLPPDAGELAALRARLNEAAPQGVTVTFEIVESVPPGRNGKLRPYYSELGGPGPS